MARRRYKKICPVCSTVAKRVGVSPIVKLYVCELTRMVPDRRGPYELCGDDDCAARVAVEYLRQERQREKEGETL